MGVFDDHKLEQLDWMTQMTETIDSDLNAILARLPDRVVISAEDIIENSSSSYLSLSVRQVLQNILKKSGHKTTLAWEEERCLDKCFAFELVGDVELDLRCDRLSGKVTLVKVVQTLSDEELLPLMGRRGIDAVGRIRDYGTDVSIERLNEILDILGNCSEDMKNRSAKKKLQRIKGRLEEIFKTNEWRIRDMALADKVGHWVRSYIVSGCLSDLVNLTKLKVMTHNNMPIYSVKEEQ